MAGAVVSSACSSEYNHVSVSVSVSAIAGRGRLGVITNNINANGQRNSPALSAIPTPSLSAYDSNSPCSPISSSPLSSSSFSSSSSSTFSSSSSTCLPCPSSVGRKLVLQLLPRTAVVRAAVKRAGHNPKLQLNLWGNKTVADLIDRLRCKWIVRAAGSGEARGDDNNGTSHIKLGGRRIAVGQCVTAQPIRFYPLPSAQLADNQDKLKDSGWGAEAADVSIEQLFHALYDPLVFQLHYAWEPEAEAEVPPPPPPRSHLDSTLFTTQHQQSQSLQPLSLFPHNQLHSQCNSASHSKEFCDELQPHQNGDMKRRRKKPHSSSFDTKTNKKNARSSKIHKKKKYRKDMENKENNKLSKKSSKKSSKKQKKTGKQQQPPHIVPAIVVSAASPSPPVQAPGLAPVLGPALIPSLVPSPIAALCVAPIRSITLTSALAPAPAVRSSSPMSCTNVHDSNNLWLSSTCSSSSLLAPPLSSNPSSGGDTDSLLLAPSSCSLLAPPPLVSAPAPAPAPPQTPAKEALFLHDTSSNSTFELFSSPSFHQNCARDIPLHPLSSSRSTHLAPPFVSPMPSSSSSLSSSSSSSSSTPSHRGPATTTTTASGAPLFPSLSPLPIPFTPSHHHRYHPIPSYQQSMHSHLSMVSTNSNSVTDFMNLVWNEDDSLSTKATGQSLPLPLLLNHHQQQQPPDQFQLQQSHPNNATQWFVDFELTNSNHSSLLADGAGWNNGGGCGGDGVFP